MSEDLASRTRPEPADVSLRRLSDFAVGHEVVSAVVDAAPDGIVMVDEAGRILLVNRQVEDLFGFDRSELLGRGVEELVPERFRNVHRAHRTRFRAEPQTRPMGTGMTLHGRRRDGSEFPVEISLSPLATAAGLLVIAVVRDVTVRVEIEADARRVHELLDAARDGLFIFDRSTLRFTYVNEGAAGQVGYTREQLLTMTPLHIAPEFTESQFRDRLAPLASGVEESTTFTTVHRRSDGVDVPVEVVVQAPAASGQPEGGSFVALVRDISDRVEAETRLHQAAQEMRLLEDRERIARDLHDIVIQRLFAAGMSLQGAASIIDEPDAVERIDRVIDELDETIRELRTAIYGLQTHTVRTGGLREGVMRVIAEERDALGTEPRVSLDGLVDVVADDVAEHLLAVLREALSNAARHAQASSVEVSIQVNDAVTLRVVDNGVGLSGGSSSGRGLQNMADRALEMGGRSEVRDRPGGGTVVEWTVPNRMS
jgi:two-component system sensor histidine kinase DevS